MNAVATPTRTRAKKVATPAAAVQQDRVKVQAPTDFGIEPNFMQGKALAALMIREALSRDDGCRADLNASYREPGELQDNFAHAFLQVLLKEPHLLSGFSAALSSMLAEGLENMPGIPESAATISYEACTSYRGAAEYEKWDAFTEPTLSEQIAYFGLQDLESEAPAPQTGTVGIVHAAGMQTAPEESAQTPRQETFAETAWYRAGEAEAVLLAIAENDGGDAALWGVITVVGEATKALAQNVDVPTRSKCLESSLLLDQAIALIEFVADRDADLAVDAGMTLLVLARSVLDQGRKGLPND